MLKSVSLVTALIVSLLSFDTRADDYSARQNYIAHLQINPVFAWPSVDLKAMEATIEQLKLSRAEIASIVAKQYGDEPSKRVSQVLYPIKFLTQMIELERIRRSIDANSGMDDLAAYHWQMQKTGQAYSAYMDQLISALLKTFKAQKRKGLEFHLGQSSFQHLAKGILGFRLQSRKALDTANERWRCLTEKIETCERARWAILAKPVAGKIDETIFSSTPAQLIEAMHRSSANGMEAIVPAGVALTTHQCNKSYPVAYYSLWQVEIGDNTPIWRAEIINDVLVHDHQVTKENVTPYEKELNRLGADGFLHQAMTNHYACPDAGTDTAEIRTLVFVHRELNEIDFSSIDSITANDARLISDLEAIAAKISEKPYVEQRLVQDFLHQLSSVFANRSDMELSQIFGEKLKQKLENLLLTYRLKTAYLSQDMMNIVYNNTAIADYVRLDHWDFLSELMFVRNAPELLLGGSNPSVITENFQQLEIHRDGTSPRLLSYNNDLADKFSIEEFSEILIRGANAEHKLYQQTGRNYLVAN